MGKIIKNYFYNVLYQLLVFIAPLITAPYLTRVLGAEHLGIANYVLTLATVFGTVGLLGTQNYAIREVAYVKNDKTKLEKTFYEIYTLRLLLGIITLFIYCCYIDISHYPYLMVIMIMYVLAWFIDPCWFYIGMEDMGKAVARNFFAKAANIVGIFIFVKGQEDYVNYVFLLSSMTLLASLLAIPPLWKYFRIHYVKVSLERIKHHLQGSLKLFWPQMAILVYLSADKILLEYFISPEAVAYYDQAEKIVKIPLSFITVLSTVMMPRLANQFAEGNNKIVENYLKQSMRFSLCLAFPMMFGIVGISATLIPWFLGTEFVPVIKVIWALAPLIILASLVGISGDQYLVATGKTNILTFSYVIAAIVNVLVNVLLIPVFSSVGAAIGTISAYLVILLIQYRTLLKQIDLLNSLGKSMVYAIKAMPMFMGILWIQKNMSINWKTTLLQILVGIIVYIFVLAISKDNMLIHIKLSLLAYVKNFKMKRKIK